MKEEFKTLLEHLEKHLNDIGTTINWATGDADDWFVLETAVGRIHARHFLVIDADALLGGAVLFYDQDLFSDKVRKLETVFLHRREVWTFADGTALKSDIGEVTTVGVGEAIQRAMAKKLQLNTEFLLD